MPGLQLKNKNGIRYVSNEIKKKLAFTIQNSATLRSHVFVISQHVTRELGKFTEFKAFSPNCSISQDEKTLVEQLTGFGECSFRPHSG